MCNMTVTLIGSVWKEKIMQCIQNFLIVQVAWKHFLISHKSNNNLAMSISRNISFVSNYLLLWRYTKEISRRLIEFNAQSPTEDNLNQHSQQRNRITFLWLLPKSNFVKSLFQHFFSAKLESRTVDYLQPTRSEQNFHKETKNAQEKVDREKNYGVEYKKNSLSRSVQQSRSM